MLVQSSGMRASAAQCRGFGVHGLFRAASLCVVFDKNLVKHTLERLSSAGISGVIREQGELAANKASYNFARFRYLAVALEGE